MSWFYLALLAPLLFAVVNLLDDNLLKFVYKDPYMATGFAGVFASLPLLSLLFLDATPITAGLATLSVLAGILTVAYLFFYFKGLNADSPAVVVALLGLAPATLPLIAYFVLGERLTLMELTGFTIVLFASLALAIPNFKKLEFSKALVPMLIAVLFIDIMSITTKYVYDRTEFYSAFMYVSLGMGIGGVFVYCLKFKENNEYLHKIRNRIKKLLPVFLAAEMIALAAQFTNNLAVSRGPVSLVRVIEGIQPMYVLLIALALYPFWPKYFHEAEEGGLLKKFILMAIIILGLSLIVLANK